MLLGRLRRVRPVVPVGCEYSYAAALQRDIAHGQSTAAREMAVHVQHVVHTVKASVPATSHRVHAEHQQQQCVTSNNCRQLPSRCSSRSNRRDRSRCHGEEDQPAVKHVVPTGMQLTQNVWGFDTMASRMKWQPVPLYNAAQLRVAFIWLRYSSFAASPPAPPSEQDMEISWAEVERRQWRTTYRRKQQWLPSRLHRCS